MAWTFWQPSKPTGLTGALATGGSLLPNTTYYFKVYAWDEANLTTGRYSKSQASPQIYSPYSDTFSITTDTSNLSVALTWDKALKRNGVTEVDAYEVMISTSDNFDTSPDDASLYPQNISYYTAATLTNAITVTQIGTSTRQKNIKDGIPYVYWDGATGNVTFKNLYDALTADPYYNIFAKKLTSFNDPLNIWGYQFLAHVVISRWSGDSAAGQYTFISLGDFIFHYGGFNCGGCKFRVEGSKLFFNGSSHAGGMSPFTAPVAGSILKDNVIQYCFGSIPNGKSWGSMGQNYNPYSSANVASSNNYYFTFFQVPGAFEQPTTAILGMPWGRALNANGMEYVGDSTWNDNGSVATGWTYYFNQASTGKIKNLLVSNKSTYLDYNSRVWGMDMTNQQICFRGGTSSFIDCIFRFSASPLASDDPGSWNAHIYHTTGNNPNNSMFYIGKTVLVTVKDKNGTPLVGAKVKFESANGINLTRANTLAGVSKTGGSLLSAGNNYDATGAVITYDDTDIYLREGSQDGSIAYPEVGKTYWYGPEKLTILSRDASQVGWVSNGTRHYTAARGVDGTPSFWILSSNWSFDHRFVEAKEYVETNANGFTFNPVIFRTYRMNSTPHRALINTFVANGWATLYDWAPIKVTVSYPGKQDKTILISDTYAISLGTTPVNLEVNMDSQLPLILVDGEKTVLNLSPSKAVNPDGWMEV